MATSQHAHGPQGTRSIHHADSFSCYTVYSVKTAPVPIVSCIMEYDEEVEEEEHGIYSLPMMAWA